MRHTNAILRRVADAMASNAPPEVTVNVDNNSPSWIDDTVDEDTVRATRALRKELTRKYETTKRKRTADGTKKNYKRWQKIFCEKFMTKYFPEVPLGHTVASFLAYPFVAHNLRNKEMTENENIILLFLQSLHEFCVKDYKDLGTSTFGSARAAVRDLFKQVGELWNKDSAFEREIQDWYKGNTRTIAEFRLSGQTKARVGKRHMFFDLYQAIAKQYFKHGLMFEWCYHVLTWNLMTRGISTSHLRWSHILTANDNCSFVIPKSKANQEGAKLCPKNVYVNLYNPFICPIYAMGLYTLLLEKQHPRDIFPGGQQLSRFAKALHRNKHRNSEIVQLLKAHGYSPDDIGVHSIRKGAGTYATNGIVAQTPSISAICLRAGWSQGAIKDLYLQYEHAQDTYLGRILAGLPVTGKDAHRFLDLPPVFGKNILDPVVKAALKRAFPVTQHPEFPASAMGVFNRMLAVVVKNHFWMTTLVAEEPEVYRNHPYLSSPFYQQTEFTVLVSKLDEDPNLMTPTGIVGAIQVIMGLRKNNELLREIITVHLPQRDAKMLGAIEKMLDDRGMNAPHATMQQIEKFYRDKLLPLLQQIPNNPPPAAQQPAAAAAARGAGGAARGVVRQLGLSAWNEWRHADGRWYAIPPNCKYPRPTSGVLSLLFQYYHGRFIPGDTGGTIMPIKKMAGTQVPGTTRKTATTQCRRPKARLAEARSFVLFLENNIKRRWPDATRGYPFPPTRADINTMFKHAQTIIDECRPSSATPLAARRRTCNQKGWTTHRRDIGKWKREQGYGRSRLSRIIIDDPVVANIGDT